jgi:hypothetical protein
MRRKSRRPYRPAIATGIEGVLWRSSGGLHARRKSGSRFLGIFGYSLSGLWYKTCCVGVQSISDFISVNCIPDAQYAWNISKVPAMHSNILAPSMT